MTRFTLLSFLLLSGFFYMTGKPADRAGVQTATFADLSWQKVPSAQKLATNSRLSKRPAVPAPRQRIAAGSMMALVALPDIPDRNPRRSANTVKTAALDSKNGKENNTRIIEEVRNKTTGATTKPLAVSYQQRYDNAKQPVLGPRLTAILLKRELRRVGCYDGNITSSWDENAREAVRQFNQKGGYRVAVDKPQTATLAKIQQVAAITCRKEAPVGRTIVAKAITTTPKLQQEKKSRQWRANVQRQKVAYRPLPTSVYRKKQATRVRAATRNHFVAAPAYRAKPRAVAKRRQYAARKAGRKSRRLRIAKKRARRKTAIRGWKRTYRRKKFGFRNKGGSISFNF